MLLTKNEMIGLIQFAVRKSASSLCVKDVDWKSTDELLCEIQTKDAKTYNLLTQFIDAYSDWFGFHEYIEGLGKSGNLDTDEQRTLTDKIQKKDSAREAIMTRIKNIT